MKKSTETPARPNATVKLRNLLSDLPLMTPNLFFRTLSDPMETEEAVLRLPSFPMIRPSES
ncbi:hypothetical protein AtNW77_Chr2g0238411 [Arabidopsis thaliana]